MKHIKIIGIILFAAALIFLARFLLTRSNTASAPRRAQGDNNVIVQRVEKSRFEARIEAIGTARAMESVDITATVSERIKAVFFEDGAVVKAGDRLVQLDDDEERAAVEEANVNLAEQKRELERIRSLHEKKMIAQQDLDSRQSAVKAAEARLTAAVARMQDRSITAPFSGMLGIRRISPGSLVSPGAVITTLDDLEVIKAEFSIPETLLSDIRQGLEIEAHSAAWPGKIFKGTVANIDSRVNPVTRAVMVQAHIPNKEYLLRAGMLLTITLISQPRDSISVPEKALVAHADRHYVFVLRPDNTVERREAAIGERDVGRVEIKSGLKEGEQIVIEGVMDLHDGSRVRVADNSSAD